MGPGGIGAPGRRHAAAPRAGQEPKEEGPAEEAPEESRPADLEPLAGYADRASGRCRSSRSTATCACAATTCTTSSSATATRSVPSGSTVAGTASYGLPAFPVPLDCPRPPAGRPQHLDDWPATPAELPDQGHRRREPAPAPRADAERDRPGARPRADRRPRQHHPRLDARLAGRHSGVQHAADVVDEQPISPTSLPGVAPSDSSRPRRIRPRSGRTATPPASAPSAPGPRSTPSSARCASAACPGTGAAASPTTTAAAPTATRHHRRSGHGADPALRAPADARLGLRLAGADVAAADARARRSERLPDRPVAGRRRVRVHGVGHQDRQPRRSCASASIAAIWSSNYGLQLVYRSQRSVDGGSHHGDAGEHQSPVPARTTPMQPDQTADLGPPSTASSSRPTSGSSCTTRR